LGADLCCDSAHKTLTVLTGGGYLHVSKTAPEQLGRWAQSAMELFASTSPSYLILQSLDEANLYLSGDYRTQLAQFIPLMDGMKERLRQAGFVLVGNEPLKLTLEAKSRGYTGTELADLLAQRGLVCEFADPDHVVFMLTPNNDAQALEQLERTLLTLTTRELIPVSIPPMCRPERYCTPRQALLCVGEKRAVGDCLGMVLVSPMVSCPPAVPVVVCGEIVDQAAMDLMTYYGVERCRVITKEEI